MIRAVSSRSVCSLFTAGCGVVSCPPEGARVLGPGQLCCSAPDDDSGRSVLNAVSLSRELGCQLFCTRLAGPEHPQLQPLEVAALFALGTLGWSAWNKTSACNTLGPSETRWCTGRGVGGGWGRMVSVILLSRFHFRILGCLNGICSWQR